MERMTSRHFSRRDSIQIWSRGSEKGEKITLYAAYITKTLVGVFYVMNTSVGKENVKTTVKSRKGIQTDHLPKRKYDM